MTRDPVRSEPKVYHAPRSGARVASFALLALLAIGCSRAPRPSAMPAPVGEKNVAGALRDAVHRWRGDAKAHRLDGALDCSAFVAAVYREVLGVELPRSSEEMARCGSPVDRHDLRPGDLVFFRPGEKMRHVGFYVGKGEFGHVSQRDGIRVSRLAEKYWKACYWTARRVLAG